jgi:small-conductance mechanosensitive channel
MKKKYYFIIIVVLVVLGIWIFLYSRFPQEVINLILLNIAFYILRKPLNALFNRIFEKRLYRAISSATINIAWLIFLFWLIFAIEIAQTSTPTFFITIISFLVVAVALNFRRIINNVASGGLLLASEQFNVGDLIETNGIQGRVKEINLNYTKIKDFDGTIVTIPNSNIYGSTVVKFTFGRYEIVEAKERRDFEKQKYYKRYVKMLDKIIKSKVKVTRYVKGIEILGSFNPEQLETTLAIVFDKYEPLLGMRPSFAIDTMLFGRVAINLYIRSKDPELVFKYTDALLRDLLYQLHPELIYYGWDEYRRLNVNIDTKTGGEK